MMRERTTMYVGGPKVALPVNFAANVADALARNGWNQTYAANYKIAPDQKGKRVSPKTMSRLTRGAGGNQIGFILLRNIEIALGLPISYPDTGWRMLPSGTIKIVDCNEDGKSSFLSGAPERTKRLLPKKSTTQLSLNPVVIPDTVSAPAVTDKPKDSVDDSNAEAVIDMIKELSQAEQDIVYLALKLTR